MLVFPFLPFLNLDSQIRRPQNWYNDLRSALDHPLELYIKASLHLFKSLFLIHLHMLFLSLPSISSKLSMHFFLQSIHIFFCSFLVFLNSLGSTVSSCVIVLLVLTVSSNGSILFLTYHPRPFFFALRTIFTPNKSSSTIFPRNIQPCNITSWV